MSAGERPADTGHILRPVRSVRSFRAALIGTTGLKESAVVQLGFKLTLDSRFFVLLMLPPPLPPPPLAFFAPSVLTNSTFTSKTRPCKDALTNSNWRLLLLANQRTAQGRFEKRLAGNRQEGVQFLPRNRILVSLSSLLSGS